MLWQMDTRRKVFRFPGATRRDGRPLGHQRAWQLFSRGTAGASATDDWPNECWQSRPEPRRKETFRPGLAAPRRIVTLRRQIKAARALPFGNFRDGARFFSRWRVGGLQRRFRWHHVAKQGGRNAKTPACFSSDACLFASMVSGRQADRFLWSSARRALANLCGSSGGRHSRTDLSKHHQLGGPQLVARRQIAGLRREFPKQPGFSSLRSRSENANTNEVARFRWALFSALVS